MTLKTISLALALTSTLISSTLRAQEQPPAKVKEYGIGIFGLSSFSIQYRWGHEKRLYRLQGNIGTNSSFGKSSSNTTYMYDSIHNEYTTSNNKINAPLSLNVGLSFSVLKIKPINEKFGLMYGGMYGLLYKYGNSETIGNGSTTNNYYYPVGTYPNNTTTKTTSQSIQPYIGLVVGAVYKINASFLIYGEISPNVLYSYTTSTINTSSTNNRVTSENRRENIHNFGISNLSNSGAMLTLVYRITK